MGHDQLPHIYLAQDTAEAFNKRFTPIFPVPQPLLGEPFFFHARVADSTFTAYTSMRFCLAG